MIMRVPFILILSATGAAGGHQDAAVGPVKAGSQQAPPALADHHLHALSPVLIKHWKEAGARFSRDPRSYTDPVFFCDRHKINKGFLLSMAHLYSTQRVRNLPAVKTNEHRLVSAENDFIGRLAGQHPQRFVGFFSVNPLRDWASDELNRCRGIKGLAGLKLHFPACEIDFHNRRHMQTMQRTFRWAVSHRVPLLVHISGFERPFGDAESRVFWRDLVKPHNGLHLYVAHLGGSGGYNERSASVLNGFTKYLDEAAQRTVYFDLSGAILAESTEGIGPTGAEDCQRLARHMKAVGLEHFLFASDYPVFSPTDYKAALQKMLPLSDAEFRTVLQNRSPLFAGQPQRKEAKSGKGRSGAGATP